MTRGWCGAGRFAMGLRNIMALQKKTRGGVRLYQGISEIVADIWRPTVKDGLRRGNPGTGTCLPPNRPNLIKHGRPSRPGIKVQSVNSRTEIQFVLSSC